MAIPFHYDEQIRRFLLQFTRMFSHFSVEYGRTSDGSDPVYQTVPIRYGDSSRQAQTIMQQNSANKVPAAPLMSFYVNALDYARDRVQEPYFTDKVQVRQRQYDATSETYSTTQGNAFTVERLMPVPYNLGLTLDIWTTNTNQKLQILEQILPYYNPSIEIQSTDNYLDWTSLSVVELNSTTWTSRSIPRGSDEPIDITSLMFTLPIWISPPARVTKGGVIHKIIASIYDDDGNHIDAISNDDLLLGTRMKIAPHGYQLLLLDNQLQILKDSAIEDTKNNSFDPIPTQDSNILWHAVTDEYLPEQFESGISQIRLENTMTGDEIVGTVSYHPTDDRFLLYTVDTDTLPQNTLSAVDAVVNPLHSGPGVVTGKTTFPLANTGQRYLLTESTGHSSNTDSNDVAQAWKGTDGSQLIANTSDIIEYDGSTWNVIFDTSENPEVVTDVEYVTNVTTGLQYKWTGVQWLRSYEGIYRGGEWAIIL